MVVEDADEGGGGRGEDLALVLEGGVGLDDGDGEVTGGVRLQLHVPEGRRRNRGSRSTAPEGRESIVSSCFDRWDVAQPWWCDTEREEDATDVEDGRQRRRDKVSEVVVEAMGSGREKMSVPSPERRQRRRP